MLVVPCDRCLCSASLFLGAWLVLEEEYPLEEDDPTPTNSPDCPNLDGPLGNAFT